MKETGVDQAETALKSREFYGGNFFDSLNPLKQVKETDGVDDKVRDSVLANMQRYTGLSREEMSIQSLRSKLEQYSQDMQAKMQAQMPHA